MQTGGMSFYPPTGVLTEDGRFAPHVVSSIKRTLWIESVRITDDEHPDWEREAQLIYLTKDDEGIEVRFMFLNPFPRRGVLHLPVTDLAAAKQAAHTVLEIESHRPWVSDFI